ncbi:hypothetical protein L9F63_006670 [Diploptera punctata]|uniref:39S ribosomal protein L30, mitochondrial n=1 Tax=Diploptera punctata TaxID=6984 RepID=A0AAD7Z9X2_DIPPU|nr:hypothetical protein L9F63_006670 [Diploptera punctata]
MGEVNKLRFPGQKDPPYQPTKLLMIERVKPVYGNPYWEKKLLKHFKLDGQKREIAIVKNIPEVNNLLWRIKHLIKVTPITTPDGLPEEGDYNGTWLTEHGEFRVSPRLRVDPKRIEATEQFYEDKAKFDTETLKKYLRVDRSNGPNFNCLLLANG